MNISIEIKAPELANAINALAAALTNTNVAQLPTATKQAEDKPAAEKTKPKAQNPVKEEAPKEEAPIQEDSLPDVMEEKPKDAPKVQLETVRAKLASLSQSGKQAQVKELITKFGAKKLTEVPAEKYADLLAAAEEIA